MSALSAVFLWLLPLALLPVIIHLLNRLRYQTVRWAAMMFLRNADRDASRRAKIRQWLILASRCLMLLLFLLALARLRSKGALARFFDQGTDMVVVLFDRSASMELNRGGVAGRERAVDLIHQGMAELGPGTRILWVDGATGEMLPLPGQVDLDRLPLVEPAATASDMGGMMRAALREIARAGVARAEIWIPSDRQAGAWMPPGANPPDWSEWAGLNAEVTLRLLDVARVQPDPGNRALQVVGPPTREGDELRVGLRLLRDREDPESVPLRIQFGGLGLREDILVEGRAFQWEHTLPIEEGQERVSAFFSLPADSNPADNEAAVAWRNLGPARARVNVADPDAARILRAALLPRPGIREVSEAWTPPEEDVALVIRDGGEDLSAAETDWLSAGGVMLRIPAPGELVPVEGESEEVSVERWNEQTGILSTEQREPLRMDLVRIRRAVDLDAADGVEALAVLENGMPLLTRRVVGEGAVYDLATLPLPEVSNLDAGYVLVPVLQRLLREGRRDGTRFGTRRLGEWAPAEGEGWESLDGTERDPRLDVGRYSLEGRVVALNRPPREDVVEPLKVPELETWARPLPLRVFEDERRAGVDEPARVEFTSGLALLGLLFLAVESWLLTRNVRRVPRRRGAWSAAT